MKCLVAYEHSAFCLATLSVKTLCSLEIRKCKKSGMSGVSETCCITGSDFLFGERIYLPLSASPLKQITVHLNN